MGKKDKQFAKSQAWLDWLSEEKAVKHTPQTQKPAREPLQASRPPQPTRQQPRYAQRVPARPIPTSSARSLGLDSSVFRSGAQPLSPTDTNLSKKTKKRMAQAASNPDGTITLNFHLPTLKLPKPTVNWRRFALFGVMAMTILTLIFGAPFIIKTINSHKSSSSSTGKTESEKPAFATLLPSEDASNYVQTSQTYDATKQVYQFKGQYNGVDIVGTEQAIPEIFKTNKNKLKEQATSIGATERLEVVGGAAYISPSDGTTSQRAIYASNQILVFVTYSGVMKNSEWVKFLQSLE